MNACNDDIINMLILTPDGNVGIESPLTKQDLSSIQQQVVGLMKSVRNANLPAEVKQDLLSALYELMDVIEDYDLHGVAGLDKATERYTGTLIRHAPALEESSSEDSVSLMMNLRDLVLTIARKLGWKLADKAIDAGVGEVLSLPAGHM